MTVGEWIILSAVLIGIAHNEWRYRGLAKWLDATGEMIGEFFDSRNEGGDDR